MAFQKSTFQGFREKAASSKRIHHMQEQESYSNGSVADESSASSLSD